MGRGVILSKTALESPVPDQLSIYPPANPKYTSGGYQSQASIWYRDTTQLVDNRFTINMDKFKRAVINFECYASNGSGQTPYVAAYVTNSAGSGIRQLYYSSQGGLGYTWYASVTVTRSDIQNGLVRILIRAFGSVYSPDNPSWCVRTITVTGITLYKN